MIDHKFKIVLLGDGGVGKSAITIQLTQNQFLTDYDPTIENSYRKAITINGQPFILDLLDTAGQDELLAMREQYLMAGEGFILVYAINSVTSFTNMDSLVNQIYNVKEADSWPMVLCGNKCDLPDTARVVTGDMGAEFAARFNDIEFFETSAKERINITEALEMCVRKVIKHKGIEIASTKDKRRRRNGCIIL